MCSSDLEQCHSVKGESRLKNPLDVLAHRGYGVPLLYVELPKSMSSIYGKMDDCRIVDLVCGHGLIEVQGHSGIEKIPRS